MSSCHQGLPDSVVFAGFLERYRNKGEVIMYNSVCGAKSAMTNCEGKNRMDQLKDRKIPCQRLHFKSEVSFMDGDRGLHPLTSATTPISFDFQLWLFFFTSSAFFIEHCAYRQLVFIACSLACVEA